MSLEQEIAKLTEALNANTAALKAGGGGSSGGGSSGGGSGASSADKSAMQAAVTEVKEKLGLPAAKAIIKEVGGVDKMADIPANKVQAVLDAAKAKLAEAADAM